MRNRHFGVELGIPVVPMVLGLVIGDTLESSIRQALAVSDGSLAIFVQRPIAAILTACCILSLTWPWLAARRKKTVATPKSVQA